MVRTEDEADDQAYRPSHHAAHLDCMLLAKLGGSRALAPTFVKGGGAMVAARHCSDWNGHGE
jgi:hypothetical protein